MKKLLSLFLTAVLMITCLVSCDWLKKNPQQAFDDISKLAGLTGEEYENYNVFTFDNFDGKAALKMERTGLGEGTIYYSADLTEGSMYLKYDQGIWGSTQDLITLSAGVNMPIDSSGGYVEGDEIYIIFETTTPVSGQVIISFVPIE